MVVPKGTIPIVECGAPFSDGIPPGKLTLGSYGRLLKIRLDAVIPCTSSGPATRFVSTLKARVSPSHTAVLDSLALSVRPLDTQRSDTNLRQSFRRSFT